MTHARWVRGGGLVFVGAAAVALTLAGCSGGASDDQSSGPSSTASANPAISASSAPTPSPAPSGFLPVDSLGASEIPWDEVRPGWFLVEWVEHDAVYAESDPDTGDGPAILAPPDASVSLLSPDGTWYSGASLKETGATKPIFWLGNDLALFRETLSSPASAVGDTSILDLRTGSARVVATDVYDAPWLLAAGGTLIAELGFGDGFGYSPLADYAPAEELLGCGSRASLAPDGVRLVCLSRTPGLEGRALVRVARVGSPGSAEDIDTFRLPDWRYELRGWLDDDTFLLVRMDESRVATGYFAYSIATRKIADFAIPFSVTDEVRFNWETKTYVDVADHAVTFFSADGAMIAEISCAADASWPGVAYSGSRALARCVSLGQAYQPIEGTLTLVDLETGAATEVAHVQMGPGQRLGVFGYPANL